MRAMTRKAGLLLLVLLLLAAAAVRWDDQRRADRLLAGEASARGTLAALQHLYRTALERGEPLPGLGEATLRALPHLRRLAGAGAAEISYAHDDVYVYGYATRPHRDADGRVVPGFLLRAWPLRFGVTGDLEYQLGDDGQLWEGQNRMGRSGTDYGFPPPFPDPAIGQPRAPWWPAALPAHM
jgi:hypothetical protein